MYNFSFSKKISKKFSITYNEKVNWNFFLASCFQTLFIFLHDEFLDELRIESHECAQMSNCSKNVERNKIPRNVYVSHYKISFKNHLWINQRFWIICNEEGDDDEKINDKNQLTQIYISRLQLDKKKLEKRKIWLHFGTELGTLRETLCENFKPQIKAERKNHQQPATSSSIEYQRFSGARVRREGEVHRRKRKSEEKLPNTTTTTKKTDDVGCELKHELKTWRRRVEFNFKQT